MTYRNTLQGRFVATGYPAVAMFFVSMFLWALGVALGINECPTHSFFGDAVGVAAPFLSFIAYCAVAFVLNNIYLFERRVPYLPAVFMWLTAVLPLLHPDFITAISCLLLVLSVTRLFVCCQETGQERAVFGAFALLVSSSFLFAQLLLVLPLFFAYLSISRMANVRNFMAALLGVLAPCWLVVGAVYVYPPLEVLFVPLKSYLAGINMFGCALPRIFYAVTVVEVVVWAVAVYVFATTLYPAKPLLRRRMLFLFLLNFYLLLLSFVFSGECLLFLAWRLPGVAVFSSYAFSLKVTRVSNIYFVSLNVAWLLLALLCLWIG